MPADATPPPPPPEPASGGNTSQSNIDFSSLSQGEKLVGLGALAAVAVYLIWELIQEEYAFSRIALVVAFYGLAIMWLKLNRKGMTWAVPYKSQLRVVGYLLLLSGVLEFISDLKFDIFDREGGTIAGAVIFYAGCAIAGFGAKQLD